MTNQRTPFNQPPHTVVERRVLAPSQTAVLLANGALAIMDSRGVQVTLDADAAYELLDMLSSHKDLLPHLAHQDEKSQ